MQEKKKKETHAAVADLLPPEFLDIAAVDVTDDEMADITIRTAEYEAEKERKRIDSVRRKTEESLRAPEWMTLENWVIPSQCKALFAGQRCSIEDAIKLLVTRNISGLIAGGTDLGKTHLAVAIARERALRGIAAARGKDPELYLEFTVYKYRNASFHQEIGKRAGVYIFDDAGKKPCAIGGEVTEYGAFITTILDERAEKRLPTIITTRYANLDLFFDRMGDDLIRRAMLQEKRQAKHVQILLEG